MRTVFGFLLTPVLASGIEPTPSNVFQLLTEDVTPRLPPLGLRNRYFKRYLYKCYQLYDYKSQKKPAAVVRCAQVLIIKTEILYTALLLPGPDVWAECLGRTLRPTLLRGALSLKHTTDL